MGRNSSTLFSIHFFAFVRLYYILFKKNNVCIS